MNESTDDYEEMATHAANSHIVIHAHAHPQCICAIHACILYVRMCTNSDRHTTCIQCLKLYKLQ